VNLLRDLRRELLHFRPHIVQTFFLDSALLGTIAARLAAVSIIIQSRRSVGYLQERFLKRTILRVANLFTTSWQCNSRSVATAIHRTEGIPEGKIEILPNILDKEYFFPMGSLERAQARQRLGIGQETPLFLAVSNLRPVKDLSTLIEAAAIVRLAVPDGQFAILGEGPLREDLSHLIKQLGLAKNVRLVGKQTDVRPWLAAADIGLLTSRSEGSSNALLEYMATGVPTVISDITANLELAEGVFFRTGDHADLAEKLLQLWRDRERQSMLRENHLRRARSYDPESLAERLQIYYQSLIARFG
jgi:glycosyltransferase involved in cell wall biosynthesis